MHGICKNSILSFYKKLYGVTNILTPCKILCSMIFVKSCSLKVTIDMLIA